MQKKQHLTVDLVFNRFSYLVIAYKYEHAVNILKPLPRSGFSVTVFRDMSKYSFSYSGHIASYSEHLEQKSETSSWKTKVIY